MSEKRANKRTFANQGGEDGSVLLLCMIILVLLSLIGIAATTTSTIESQISGNERLHRTAFYTAESGWRRAVAWLDSQYPGITTNLNTASAYQAIVGSTGSQFTLANNNNNTYEVAITFAGAEDAPGYSSQFRRYVYSITSTGSVTAAGWGGSSRNAASQVQVTAGKIFNVGGY